MLFISPDFNPNVLQRYKNLFGKRHLVKKLKINSVAIYPFRTKESLKNVRSLHLSSFGGDSLSTRCCAIIVIAIIFD